MLLDNYQLKNLSNHFKRLQKNRLKKGFNLRGYYHKILPSNE